MAEKCRIGSITVGSALKKHTLFPIKKIRAQGLLITLAFLALVSIILANVGCSKTPQDVTSISGEDLHELFIGIDQPQQLAGKNLDQFGQHMNEKMEAGDSRVLWPIFSFLYAETLRLQGNESKAAEAYRELVEWAYAKLEDKNEDGWGTSGLVTVALWRWLCNVDQNPNASSAEMDKTLDMGPQLLRTRFAQGMFKNIPIFGSLPQLQEHILRRLVSIAVKRGKRNLARDFLLEYFMNSSDSELSSLEEDLLNEAISMGIFSRGRIAVFRAKYLSNLGKNDIALSLLERALEDEDPQVQAEASLLAAELTRKLSSPCLTNELFGLYDKAIKNSNNPDIIHEALLRRARASIRDGCIEDPARFTADLNQIINDCPECYFTDDALLEFASYHLGQYWKTKDSISLNTSIAYFEKLQQFAGENDFIESSRFVPAMALFSRGETEDKTKSRKLLLSLEEISPRGPFHSNAIFWLGRLAEEAGEGQLAEGYFKQLVKETPYGYYGIRAQMHLDEGASARRETSPRNETLLRIKDAHKPDDQQKSDDRDVTRTAYLTRVESLLYSGVYGLAMGAFSRIRHDHPAERIENLSLEELDKKNLLAQIALLMAIRQDAFAASDKSPDAKTRIYIAGLIGEQARDWPTTVYLSGALNKPFEVMEANQNDPGYGTVAFPNAFEDLFNECTADYNLPPGLLYGIVRREAAFFPDALSTSGALGLFQFIPRTFDSLDQRYNLLRESGKGSREEFLLDPRSCLKLGARYLKDELLARYKDNIVFALMDHIAGAAAVKEWSSYWRQIHMIDDYEFILESTGFSGVGPFVRSVLATYWIKGLSM